MPRCILLLVVVFMVACGPRWELDLARDGEQIGVITGRDWQRWAKAFPGEIGDDALPLERALWESGIQMLDDIHIAATAYAWRDIYRDSWLLKNGDIRIQQETLNTEALRITIRPETQGGTLDVLDFAPTIAGALEVASPSATAGRALAPYRAQAVAVVVVDGLGYHQYARVQGHRVLPFLDTLGQPKQTRSVYPTTANVAMAAMVTGAGPQRNGVRTPDGRAPEAETLFEVLSSADKAGIVIEGSEATLDLVAAEVIVAEDEATDGSTDDDVAAAALRIAQDSMPDLLWVRLTGIATVGAAHGLDSDETLATMTEVDQHVKRLTLGLPSQTLVLITSSFGLHAVKGQDDSAIHGSLLPADVLVPLWVVQL